MQTTLKIRAHRTKNGRGVEYECPRLTIGTDVLYAVGLDVGDLIAVEVHPRTRRVVLRPAPEPVRRA